MPPLPWTKENHLAAQHEAMQLLPPQLTQYQALALYFCPRAPGGNLLPHLPALQEDDTQKALCVTRNSLNTHMKTVLKRYSALLA